MTLPIARELAEHKIRYVRRILIHGIIIIIIIIIIISSSSSRIMTLVNVCTC